MCLLAICISSQSSCWDNCLWFGGTSALEAPLVREGGLGWGRSGESPSNLPTTQAILS